jgi:Pseudomurein-binding repeat
LNEVVASFVQDSRTVADGLFNDELPPQELTQVRMGKIIREKYPNLEDEDQEAVRQHAVAALNVVQQAVKTATAGDGGSDSPNTALIDGVRRFAMDVRELNIDLIDSINPFSEAYAILSKAMNQQSLQQVAAVIAARKVQLSPDEARELATRALRFKRERGRLPSITSPDAWEKRMAEGVEYLKKMKQESADG